MKFINLKPFFLFFIIAFTQEVFAQNIPCIDSISFNQYFPVRFKSDQITNAFSNYEPQRDQDDNIFLSGRIINGGPNNYWSVQKFNADNELVWSRNYKEESVSGFVNGGAIHGMDEFGNLVFSQMSNPLQILITKTNNQGFHLWTKKYRNQNNPAADGAFSKPIIGENGELYSGAYFLDFPGQPVITALNNDGTVKWSIRYKHASAPDYKFIGTPILASMDANTLAMVIPFWTGAPTQADPAAKNGIQICKINKATGAVSMEQSFMLYKDPGFTTADFLQIVNFNFDTTKKEFLIVCQHPSAVGSRFSFIKLGENFNITRFVNYSSEPINVPQTKAFVNKKNQVILSQSDDANKNLSFATFDDDLDISGQRFIDLDLLGMPDRNFTGSLAFKKDGIINFQLATFTGGISTEYLFLFDNSPFYDNVSACLGIDSIIFKLQPLFIRQVPNPPTTIDGNMLISVEDLVPPEPPVSFPFPKTELCKKVSICDQIKITGAKNHCISNPIDSFKLFKNPLCLRKTKWSADESAIRILKFSDTSLQVEFLKSFRGYIYAGFQGCNMMDSIYIEVYDLKQPVSLGKDPILCPNKSIVLDAGTGFRNYLWQNNLTSQTITVNNAGLYHVTVTDSCGNISRDSVNVLSPNLVLQLDYPLPICNYDTATLILPSNFLNYNWQPSTNSILVNNKWKLFPASTTIYKITGELLPGCLVSDTVLIKVQNCPSYIYFPTAFTPNHDGWNDLYKPLVSGRMLNYNFTIYNRYGQIVFNSMVPNVGWDGRLKGGRPLAGGYVWMCTYQFPAQKQINKRGTFLLLN